MDVCKSKQPLVTGKPPSENNHGTILRPRYKSPTPKRYSSPNTRTVTVTVTPPAPIPKRAVSAGRRSPATPPSPPARPSTPVHDTSVNTELGARKTIGGKLPESLWPSRMRSLSVSFQSNTFSMPISKKEKPPPQALFDRTLKPSSNVTTPERKPSPIKGKTAINQSENSKPLLHARSLDNHHRRPSKTGSNVLNKSIDLPDKAIKTLITPNPGTTRRMLLPNNTITPLQRSKSEKNGLMTIGSIPSSPNKSSGVVSRGVSPCRTRALSGAPSRGGPNRSSSPSRRICDSNTVSVLTFVADIKKGKNVVSRIEDAHHLRLLYNRQVQWRFVNASAEASLNSQKVTAEKSLINVQRTTSGIRDSVAAKRMNIYDLRLQLKLYLVLNQQIAYLNQWSSIEREHNFAVHGAIEDLQASTLRLPVTGGATADTETVKLAVYSAIQVMQTMGSSIHSTLSRLEGTNCLVSELATVAAQERALLAECESLLASAAFLQVEEYSLKTHLVQLKQASKSLNNQSLIVRHLRDSIQIRH